MGVKKVLAIMGSPRGKGNGYRITQRIEAEMGKMGEVEFTYLFLKDVEFEPCRGCFLCISHGEDRCPVKDSRVEIEGMIEASDGVILVSPTYVQNVTSLMKVLTERFAYTHHRPKFFDKKMLLVANGGSGLPKVLDALRIVIGGPHVVHELQVLAPPWPLNDKPMAKQDKAIKLAARRFTDALHDGRPHSPSLGEYLVFRFFKITNPETRKWLPADYEYYKDKEKYYYPVKSGVGKRIAAAFITRLVLFLAKDMGPRKEEAS